MDSVMLDRRVFVTLAAAGLAGRSLEARARSAPAAPSRIRAVAFDAFTVFDPRPVAALAENLFPGKGAALSEAWRTRQFEYQWLRALSGRYADFRRTTDQALQFASRSLRLELAPAKHERLMQAWLELESWPDAPAALRALRDAGLRLAFLSNMTPRMLEAGIARSDLHGVFDHVLSTDEVRTYKPDPRAYRLAMDAFRLEREEVLFAPSAGWDAAGGRWFGYPTFWVDRLGLPAEELEAPAAGTGRDLHDLVEYVQSA